MYCTIVPVYAVYNVIMFYECTQLSKEVLFRYSQVNAYTRWYGDLGWYPLEIYRKIEAIRLWNRFVKMCGNRMTKKVFMWN